MAKARSPLSIGQVLCVPSAHCRRVNPYRRCSLELRQIREWAVRGVLVITVIGKLSDGTIGLFDVRADSASVVAMLDSAL